MQGRVAWYQPASRGGRLITTDGQSMPFVAAENVGDLQGGDVVRFQVDSDHGGIRAVDLEVAQTCVDHLSSLQPALVSRFHATVSIRA